MGENPSNKTMENNILFSEKLVDILSIEHTQMTIDNFVQLKAVSIQRKEEDRFKKTMNVLGEKLLPTHLEVAVIIPNFEDDFYEYGKPYSINGNTRKFIWKNHPEMRPNRMLNVTVYRANTRTEIDEIYRSIDSQDSVETPKQMLGGILRESEIELTSKYLKRNSWTTGLRHAYGSFIGNRNAVNYTKVSFNEIKNKKEFHLFKEEILFIDTFYRQYQNLPSSERFNTLSVFTSLLIVTKKYGVDNPKVTELMHNLFNLKTIIHDGTKGLNDGVSIINIDLYDYYRDRKNGWATSSGGSGSMINGMLIYCMDAFINDRLLSIKKGDSRFGIVMREEVAKEYFENYFKN